MKKLVLIKLGGSVITDKNKPNTIREDNIVRLVDEIFYGYKKVEKDTLFLIGTGGGSFSHPPAAEYQLEKGITGNNSLKGLSVTADAEIRMNRIVMSQLLKLGLNVMSFAPASFLFSENHKITQVFIDPIKQALKENMIPVVYGDMVIDQTKGCMTVSTEVVFSNLAKNLKSEFSNIKIIYCGLTDGVYDNNGKTISVVSDKNISLVKKFITGSAGIDVTGGMIHKVEESLAVAKDYGISTLIVNGNRPGSLYQALLGNYKFSTLVRD